MTGVGEQHLFSDVQLIVPSVKFNAKGTQNTATAPPLQGPVIGDNGGNAGEVAPVPSFFLVKPISDRARFGFSVTGPLGGGVDYGSDFVGRYSIRDVTLLGVGISPSVAYQVTDKLSIGAAVECQDRLDESPVAGSRKKIRVTKKNQGQV